MNEENLVGYMMEGISILKNIREANAKVNAEIDSFLKRLADAAAKEEPTKATADPKASPSGAAEDLNEKMREMLQKIQAMQDFGKSTSGGTLGFTKEQEEAMREAQSSAIHPMRAAELATGGFAPPSSGTVSPSSTASLSPTPLTAESSPPTMGAEAGGTAIETKGAMLGSGGARPLAKPSKIKKLGKADMTGTKGSGPTASVGAGVTVDADDMNVGRVYCAVCEVYHSPLEDAASL